MTDGEAAGDVGGPHPARRTVPAGALVLAIMVAAALGMLAVFALATDGGGGGGADGELDDARLAAGRFAERFLTFDDESIDAWREDIRALSTAGFAEEVDEVQDGLRRLIAEAELDATAEVTEIFVGDIDRGAVEVVVTYDRQLTSASGAREETDRYMQLALLRVDGDWLVDNVIDIATATADDADAEPTAPAQPSGSSVPTTGATTTSAPG